MTPETITAHGTTYLRIDLVRERHDADLFGNAGPVAKVSRFNEFWDTWPKRGGKKCGKAQAQAQYAKAVKSGASENTLIAAAKEYAKDNAFPKDAFRWIRDQNYEDETPEREAQSPDALKFWAGLVNGSKPVFGLSMKMVDQLLAANLVTIEKLKERELI